MKYKITDLMDLYEDKNCTLPPVSEPENENRGAQCAPLQNDSQEPQEIKASRHRYGWKEITALAAALVLVVLGGFGVKRLLDRGALQPGQTGDPGQTGTAEWSHPETNEVVWLGWEPISGEEQEALSRFLTVFAQQGVETMHDLDEDAELIRFAFIYRRICDPESIPVQRGDDGELWDTLSPEQVNETLTKLLGKTVTPDEKADYNLLRSDPVGGHCGFHDGYFWQEPSGEDHLLRFALATDALNSRDGGRLEVMFTTYEVQLLYWGNGDLYPLPGLSTEEAEALAQESKLHPLGQCVAEILETGDGYRLLNLTPQTMAPEPTEPPAEDTEEDIREDTHTEPTGFDAVPDEDWARINEQLSALARQGFPELEEYDQDEDAWEPFPDQFALATALTNKENDLFEVSFEAYMADPLLWPDYYDIDPAQIEDLSEFLESDAVKVIGSGAAVFERQNGDLRLTRYSYEDPQIGHPDPDEDLALRAEIEALFAEPGSWYARALSSFYADPADVDLSLFFYDGIPGAGWASNEELREMYSEDAYDEDGDFMGPPTDRLPRQDMDRILLQYFGLSLEQSSKRGLNRLSYREDTDCYYHCHGDTNIEFRDITAVRRLEDGTVLCTYRDGFWNDLTDRNFPALHTAGLRPVGSGAYQILFNLPGRWITAKDLGDLGALFRLSGAIKAETRDADGTVTVRELSVTDDAELCYREGDPDSEYSYWGWCKWWLADDHTFCCAMCETLEDGNRIGPWRTLTYRCGLTEDELILVQESENGFSDDAPGTELRFQLNGA